MAFVLSTFGRPLTASTGKTHLQQSTAGWMRSSKNFPYNIVEERFVKATKAEASRAACVEQTPRTLGQRFFHEPEVAAPPGLREVTVRMNQGTPLTWLANWFGSMFSSPRDWIQVEVTTHCNAACVYCPRTVLGDRWPNEHMSLSTFRRLLPELHRTPMVHLQGWGEPFLNPEFFHMVALAKKAGCRVGTTTNGMLLREEVIAKLVACQVDTVAFSLAGLDETNNTIRRGTSLARVMEAIRALREERERREAAKPEIHIAYMLFRSGLNELEAIPGFFQGLGVSHVIISTLDFALTRELEAEVIWPRTTPEFESLRSRLDAVVAEGERFGLRIHYHLPFPLPFPGIKRPVCTENVQRALCITAQGDVSPCVYTNLSVFPMSYIRDGVERPYERLCFGSVLQRPLRAIWRQGDYVSFRNSFGEGRLADPCRDCPKLCGT